MRTPRLVATVLIICSLVVLALQNSTPSVALVFLGLRTVTLPLGVWLSGAIALGALTTVALVTLANLSWLPRERSARRRWTVRPESSSEGGTYASGRDWQARSSGPASRPATPPRETPPRDRSPRSQSDPSFSGQRPAATTPRRSDVTEDWQAWGQRSSPSQWTDWSDASGNDPRDENLSRRQRQERQQVETVLEDLDQGWDESAQGTVYVAPGGSDVEDVLDDIEEGWEDWDAPDNPLADTAYSQQYEGAEKSVRQDAIYGPPDDARAGYQAWSAAEAAGAAGEETEDSVYDADYRVIIPPYRPLGDDENGGDRPA